MIERSRVRVPAGAAEEFSSSPESVSVLSLISVYVLPQCYRSNTKKLSRSFYQKCRWQFTVNQADTLRMWLRMK